MPVVFSPPSLSRTSIENIVKTIVDQKLAQYKDLLDGVSLEELTNFNVPLTGQQTPEELKDGILLGYKDGKLVEETDLNGGQF
jgi:hypothetical protein